MRTVHHKMYHQARKCLAFLAIVLTTATFCWAMPAEVAVATLQGTVYDPAGAPLPEAMVRAKNPETALTLTARTNAQGQFEIRKMVPGKYSVQISRSGFVSQAQEELSLAPGQSATVSFALVASASSGPQQGETATGREGPNPSPAEASGTSSSTANRISESQLAGLPMNGRSYSQLATLQAGVSSESAGSSASRGVGGGGLNVSGSRSTSNSFLLDGTNIMNTENQVPRSAAGVQLGSDSIAQVQVFSTSYSAEYGRGSGGVLNSISRNGTDEFHGTLFEFLRNSKLDSRNFVDGPEPPPFKRNQFGFTLSGPVRKERTYIMGSFEAMRDRLSETAVDNFPDALAWKGIIKDKDGKTINECVYPQNRPACVFPEVLRYRPYYPIPNGAAVGDGIAENRAPVFQPTNENFFVVRVDHKISDKDSFFVRYSFDDATSISSGSSFLFRTKTLSRQQYLTLVESHIFSLSAVNVIRLGYTRPVSFTDDDTSIGIPSDLFFVPGVDKSGTISISGLTTFGPDGSNPETRMMNSFQFADNLLLQRGDHALKFGFDIHRYRWDVHNQTQKFGGWTFSSLQSFLQGGPSGTRLGVALPGSNNQKALRQTLLGFYAQDDFRLRPNLRLNLGLRYEFATIIRDKDGKTSTVRDPIRDTGPTIGPYYVNNPSLLDFSPRLGLSWSPGGSGNTAINASFGIYNDRIVEYIVHQLRSSVPFHTRVSRVNFDATKTFPNAIDAVREGATPPVAQTSDYSHLDDSMVLRYDFNIEQQLPGGWRGRIAYVGARGNHLFRSSEINQIPVPIILTDGSLCFPPDATVVPPELVYPSCPAVSKERAGPVNPAFSSINFLTSDAQSFYNAVQFSASKNLSRGFSIQGNYTYSKSVDDTSNQQGTDYSQYALVRTLARGLSNFDTRHRLSVNYFYSLPFGSGRSGVLPYLLGAWRLGGIVSVRSGNPFSPEINVPTRGYLFSARSPNLNPGKSNNPVLGGTERYFDPSAFSVPLPGTLGNVGRNTITGPSVFNMDISLQKEFLIDAKRRLQFRAEFFNLPNHTNLEKPGNTTVFSGAYPGRLNPIAGRIRSTATTARQIQFALRFSF